MTDDYIVMENDTLDSISSKFNISPEIIENLNGYNTDLVPGGKNNKYFDYYTVSKGDTLYKIAYDNNIDSSLLAQLNGINEEDYIYPNQVLLIPKAGSILYITAIGDTLDEIVKGFNINIQDLIEQNNKIYLQPEQLIVYKYK